MNDTTDIDNAKIAEYLGWLNAFMTRKTETCFYCGKQVVRLEQVGRCVYGSCGCRMWQGRVPAAWEVKVKR